MVPVETVILGEGEIMGIRWPVTVYSLSDSQKYLEFKNLIYSSCYKPNRQNQLYEIINKLPWECFNGILKAHYKNNILSVSLEDIKGSRISCQLKVNKKDFCEWKALIAEREAVLVGIIKRGEKIVNKEDFSWIVVDTIAIKEGDIDA